VDVSEYNFGTRSLSRDSHKRACSSVTCTLTASENKCLGVCCGRFGVSYVCRLVSKRLHSRGHAASIVRDTRSNAVTSAVNRRSLRGSRGCRRCRNWVLPHRARLSTVSLRDAPMRRQAHSEHVFGIGVRSGPPEHAGRTAGRVCNIGLTEVGPVVRIDAVTLPLVAVQAGAPKTPRGSTALECMSTTLRQLASSRR
jgi:hypothetical protein